MPSVWCIAPSVPLFTVQFIPHRVVMSSGPIPIDLGHKTGNGVDGVLFHHKAQSHTLKHHRQIRDGNQTTAYVFGLGKNPENPEENMQTSCTQDRAGNQTANMANML